jgi:hypothetical protein
MSEITPPDTGLAKLEAIPFGPTGVTSTPWRPPGRSPTPSFAPTCSPAE